MKIWGGAITGKSVSTDNTSKGRFDFWCFGGVTTVINYQQKKKLISSNNIIICYFGVLYVLSMYTRQPANPLLYIIWYYAVYCLRCSSLCRECIACLTKKCHGM